MFPSNGVSVLAGVSRTLAIVEALAGEKRGLTFSDLHGRLRISKSVLSKVLSTMSADGYVVQDPETKRYRLTYKLIAFVQRHVDALELEDYYRPILRELAQKTGELVQLAVVLGSNSMVFVGKIDGTHPLRIASRVGQEVSLHANAPGKAWLASLNPEYAVQLAIRKGGLQKFTSRTITTIECLLEDLEETRRREFAISNEEFIDGIFGIAAPVRVRDEVVAGVNVVIPTTRATEEVRGEIARHTVEAANQLAETWPETWRLFA